MKETLEYAIESGKAQEYYTELSKMFLICGRENEDCVKEGTHETVGTPSTADIPDGMVIYTLIEMMTHYL